MGAKHRRQIQRSRAAAQDTRRTPRSPFARAATMLANKSACARPVRAGASRRSVRVEATAARRSWAPGVKAPAHLTGE